jgi:hypothetical protein
MEGTYGRGENGDRDGRGLTRGRVGGIVPELLFGRLPNCPGSRAAAAAGGGGTKPGLEVKGEANGSSIGWGRD